MRKVTWVLPLLFACGKPDATTAGPSKTPTNTGVAAALPAPHRISEADIAGTWRVTTSATTKDSIRSTVDMTCGNGLCEERFDGGTQVYVTEYSIEGDSVVANAASFIDPRSKQLIIEYWVAYPVKNKLTGHGVLRGGVNTRLVVSRFNIEGERVNATRGPLRTP